MVKKEESLDDTISKVYDEIHSANSTDKDTDSDGGGFIGQHMKKVAEKKRAEEEAKKLAEERQWALDHPGFVAESAVQSKKKKKNHKKGILERVEEKIQSEVKEKEQDDSAEIMEQALNDPSYVEQIELMKKMKKRGIIADEKDPSKEELSPEDKAANFAEKLLGDKL